ncbi:OprO/OprP family phosphate-selective porin [Marinobacter sp.]|uniref:OprO/OprP family phosphate-selective porin n=1 Tax=Marinobacter sp. TaxID=50741 RepID=UPI003B525671
MSKQFVSLALAISTISVAHAGTVTSEGKDLIINTESGIEVKTTDDSASFQLGGRLQWDYDATQSDGKGDTTDLDVRRARLYIKGRYGDWAYKTQFNVAESDGADGGTVEDLYIRYHGLGSLANITVGKQKEPFGLEELTSSKDISALERSAMTERYAPGRNAGVQLSGAGSNWTYGVGYFEAEGDSSNDFDNTAITARGTIAPLQTKDAVVHLGAGYTTRDAAVPANEVDTYNLELAGAMGPLHAQAEYFDSEVGQVELDGYYVQVGWIITGESRPYKAGAFKRVKPSSPQGAWEVIARYEDGDGKFSDVGLATTEGEQTTLGVNYYANKNVRLGLSYMDGKEASGETGDEVRARFQYAF